MNSPANPDSEKKSIIGCGMYAFTTDLRQSWRSFFNCFRAEELTTDAVSDKTEVQFSAEDHIYSSEYGLIAQTCGYPYLKKWRESHIPVCVPVFDINGCEGEKYLSWFIKPKTCHKTTLEDFRNTRVAINGRESNSGMNVLRFAVSSFAKNAPFFSEVKETGAHYQSMFAVANGEAELASIDAVSFYFACQAYPELIAKIDIFEQSKTTVGLPFIQKRNASASPESVTKALNKAVEEYQQQSCNKLRLKQFNLVEEAAYLPMLEMEQEAEKAGYRTLA